MVAVGDVLGAARILVIDDEPANVRMLDRLLTTSGCRHVTTLTDPREVIGQMPIASARIRSSMRRTSGCSTGC